MKFASGIELEPHEKVLKEVSCSLDQLMGEKGRLVVTTQRIVFAVAEKLGGRVVSIPATKLAGVEVAGSIPKHLRVTAITEHGQAVYSFTNWSGSVGDAFEAVKALIDHYSGSYSKELREVGVEARLAAAKGFKEKLGLFFIGLGAFLLFLWLWLQDISVVVSLQFVVIGLLLKVYGGISKQAKIKKVKAETMEFDLLIEKSMQYAGEFSSQPVEPLEAEPGGFTVKEEEKPAKKGEVPAKALPKEKAKKKPVKDKEKKLEEELKKLREELGVSKK